MFKQLSRRMLLSLLATTFIGTATVGAVAYYVSSYIIRSEFDSLTYQYFGTSANNLSQFITYTEETVKMIVNNNAVAQAIQAPDYQTEVPNLLDSLFYTLKIDFQGLTIYTDRGNIYTLNSYSGVPTLDQLKEDARIGRFLADPAETGVWMSRFDRSDTWYNKRYANNGIFSYLVKIPGVDGKTAAIAVVDMNAEHLADFFETSSPLFGHAQTFLLREGDETANLASHSGSGSASPEDIGRMSADMTGWFVSSDSRHLIVYGTIKASSEKIVLSVPLSNTSPMLLSLKWTILLLSAAAALLSAYGFLRLKTGIIRRLSALWLRMRQYNSSAHPPFKG